MRYCGHQPLTLPAQSYRRVGSHRCRRTPTGSDRARSALLTTSILLPLAGPAEAYLGPVRVLFALGGLFLVVGVIWLGQGVGLIGGSFMTGEAVWAVIGAVSIVFGAFLVRAGFRWRHAASVDDDV
jgi:hypothetical protein